MKLRILALVLILFACLPWLLADNSNDVEGGEGGTPIAVDSCLNGCTGNLVKYPSTAFTYQGFQPNPSTCCKAATPPAPYTLSFSDNDGKSPCCSGSSFDTDYVTVFAPSYSFDPKDPTSAVNVAFGEGLTAYQCAETFNSVSINGRACGQGWRETTNDLIVPMGTPSTTPVPEPATLGLVGGGLLLLARKFLRPGCA